MAAKSTNTKKSSTNNITKAAKNATTKKTSTTKKASASTKKSSGSKTKRTSNHINTAQSQEIRSEILLLGSLAICILLIPMGIIALVIKKDSPGPALFKQKRTGVHQKIFTVFNSICSFK